MDGGGQMDVGGAEALEDGAAAAQRPAPMAVDGGDEVDGGRSAAAGAPAANEAAAGAVRPVDNCGPLTGPDGEMLYCICREPHNPDDPRFMIGCDGCLNWFHGDCIGLQTMDEAAQQQEFFCAACRAANPALEQRMHEAPRPPPAAAAAPQAPAPRAPSPPRLPECSRPGCSQLKAPDSKYCCLECGMLNLRETASKLLRCSPDGTDGPTEQKDREELVKLDKDIKQAQEKIALVSRQRRTLDALVRRAAQTPLPAAPVPSDMDATPGQEPLIDCVGCGVELPVVKAVRHFHKCFRKMEAEISLSAAQPQTVEGCDFQAICNHYDKTHKVYCSRLHALCPEHGAAVKLPSSSSTEICGCPLDPNVFAVPSTAEAAHPRVQEVALCMRTRRKCNEHYGWEHLRRAELAQETVSQLFLISYCKRNQYTVQLRLSRRTSILTKAFMHSERMTKERAAEEAEACRQRAAEIAAASEQERLWRQQQKDGDEDRPSCTGGSLHLPRRHWR